TPDLDGIVLEPGAHSRRGTRLTLLELVSWLNHEPHSDSPSVVTPVVAAFARWLSAGVDDATRQTLRAIAPRLLTVPDTSDGAERRRQWVVTEWLVKAQAPAWLRAAGLLDAAERLEQ